MIRPTTIRPIPKVELTNHRVMAPRAIIRRLEARGSLLRLTRAWDTFLGRLALSNQPEKRRQPLGAHGSEIDATMAIALMAGSFNGVGDCGDSGGSPDALFSNFCSFGP
ncbi:MAG: hypothetical protein OK455_05360 [Thaumarchaeota archaeon]|nr:hypothetical protein [Nitrososphaerota archaeon]